MPESSCTILFLCSRMKLRMVAKPSSNIRYDEDLRKLEPVPNRWQNFKNARLVVGIVDAHPGNATAPFPRRALLKRTVAVESTVRHTGDRFIGAGDESVENRQYATDGLLLEIDFHVFGDEVGRRERGLHCVLQVAERAEEVCDAKRIRQRTHRFLPAKDVHRGTRKKLI